MRFFCPESGNLGCVSLLLDHVALLEEIDEDTKKALLVHAITHDRPSLVENMLDKFSIDINSKYLENGSSTLHKAATSGSLNCIKLLISLKCDVNVVNDAGETALHLAVGNGHSSCVEALIEGGAGASPAPNWLIGDNQTPLMIAAYNNYQDVVKILLPFSDVNCVSEYGDSALHYAAARGCRDTVRTLINSGAAVNQRNCCNATPLWNCVAKPDVLSVLLQAGAATDIPSTGIPTNVLIIKTIGKVKEEASSVSTGIPK